MNPVIGELTDFCGFNESRFKVFSSASGISGLGFVEGSRIELLAVEAPVGTKGCFREFIAQCKDAYAEIRIWCVMNPTLASVLERYGFTSGHDMDQYGQMQEVWEWKKGER